MKLADVPPPSAPATATTAISPAPNPIGIVALTLLTIGLFFYGPVVAHYNRLTRDRLANGDIRGRVVALLRDQPGLTCGAIALRLGVHYTTAVYHLRALARFQEVVAHAARSRMRYFLGNGAVPRGDRDEFAAMRRPSDIRFLRAAVHQPAFRISTIADKLGLAKSTVSRRARTLLNEGFVERSGPSFKVTERGLRLARRASASGRVPHGFAGAPSRLVPASSAHAPSPASLA